MLKNGKEGKINSNSNRNLSTFVWLLSVYSFLLKSLSLSLSFILFLSFSFFSLQFFLPFFLAFLITLYVLHSSLSFCPSAASRQIVYQVVSGIYITPRFCIFLSSFLVRYGAISPELRGRSKYMGIRGQPVWNFWPGRWVRCSFPNSKRPRMRYT